MIRMLYIKIKQETGKHSGYLSPQFNVFLERQMLQSKTVKWGFEENSKTLKRGFKVYYALHKWGFGVKTL